MYDKLWNDVIRPEALKRAGYKCESCKCRHHSQGYRNEFGAWIECDEFQLQWCKVKGIKPKRMYLQVAHLDHDRSNNSPINLKVLCPRCHLNNDKDIRAIMRKTNNK